VSFTNGSAAVASIWAGADYRFAAAKIGDRRKH
jgi:hypothetical protein